jgi:hypothetical protein
MSLNCGNQGVYCSFPRRYMNMDSHGGMILTGEDLRTPTETYSSATLSTTNPTRTGLGVNPGLCDNLPATNRLSHLSFVTDLVSVDLVVYM